MVGCLSYTNSQLQFQFTPQLKWRLSDRPVTGQEPEEQRCPEYRAKTRCKVFLACTSNMLSSGIRETVKFLVQHKLVSACVRALLCGP